MNQITHLICILIAAGYASCSLFSNLIDKGVNATKNVVDKLVFRNVCFDTLGCFYNGPPFYDPLYRPISPVPNPARDIKYYLFTRSNRLLGHVVKQTTKSLNNSPFDASRPTIFLVLGYISNPYFFAQELAHKDKILREGDYNVFVPEYFKYMLTTLSQAVANTRTVGARMGEFINFITNNTEAKPESFTLVGWSLGAHIAGYAGKRIRDSEGNPLLGQITAEDAAGPYYGHSPPEVRLSQGDAIFVQAIHTDDGTDLLTGYGDVTPYGDYNFYVNGGSAQPGCGITSKIPDLGTIINDTQKVLNVYCNHDRSRKLYYESIDDSQCKFIGVSCGNYDDYLAGKCNATNSYVEEMGFHAKRNDDVPRGTRFYLQTHAQSPYCIKMDENDD